MIRNALETGLTKTLTRRAQHRAFPLFVAGAAFASTLSMTVPFASLLIIAALMAPKRWKAIALWASLGAAVGAALLYLAFHHLGWARLFDSYPDVVRSTAWADAMRWLTAYGTAALFVIAALPLPLTPALMFAAISRLPVGEVLVALWLGKLLKYAAYAWFTSAFPHFLIDRKRRRLAALHAALASAVPSDAKRD